MAAIEGLLVHESVRPAQDVFSLKERLSPSRKACLLVREGRYA
jgi:hypothetical protein